MPHQRLTSKFPTKSVVGDTRSDYVSPLVKGGRRAASIAERARERTHSDDELRRVWIAAEADKVL